MTCLIAPPAFLADNSDADPRQQQLIRLAQAYQALLNQWHELGLNPELLLGPSEGLARLTEWSQPQLLELQKALVGLSRNSQACAAMADVLGQIAERRSVAPDFSDLSLTMRRCLVLIRPLLNVQPTIQSWPRIDGDPLSLPLLDLGLTLRTYNKLCRQGIHCLTDLAGRNEAALLSKRGFGAGSIVEIQAMLDRHGLNLPFSLDDGFTLPPLPAPMQQPVGWSLCVDQSAERQEAQEWVERAVALLTAASNGEDAGRLLRNLQALTLERYSSQRVRLDEIHQLQDVFGLIAEAAVQAGAMAPLSPVVANVVQQQVMLRYALLIEQGQSSSAWTCTLRGQLRRAPQALPCLLLRLSGLTLQQIGTLRPSSRTREAVRAQIQKAEQAFCFQVSDLVRICNTLLKDQQQQQRDAQLRQWIHELGRIPFWSDEHLIEEPSVRMANALLSEVLGLSLARRLSVYSDLEMDVPDGEWDLHFRVLMNSEQRPGQGYWHTLEPLRQFLPRLAVLLGEPRIMPFQEQLPPAVRGAVTRHGGQSAVAQALGLTYRGQLVGEHGRTYWTYLRLEQLLDQVVAFLQLPAPSMPSRNQIRVFMQSGVIAEYLDKQPESVISALTSQYTMSWEEVAVRFHRC